MNANVVNALNGLLADSIVLNQKLHHFHWRVQGPGFFQLHAKFEELYNHVFALGDELAERILMVGGQPLARLQEAIELSSVKEMDEVPAGQEMVALVRADLDGLRRRAKAGLAAAEEAGDGGSANLLDGLVDHLDKEIWMLDAFLAG